MTFTTYDTVGFSEMCFKRILPFNMFKETNTAAERH